MKTNPFAGMPLPRSDSDSDDMSVLPGGEDHAANSLGTGSGGNQILLRAPGEYSTDPDIMERELANLHLETIEEGNLEAIEELTERTGMPVIQENGQRRYGPPPDYEGSRPRGTEIFVGKLPRNCFEPDLVPVFEKAGRIYEMRLMMDFSGTNRGYCFVQYFTPEEADRAVAELHNYEIRKGRRIGIVKSVDNCRLYLGHLPKDKSKELIKEEISRLVDGLIEVDLVTPHYGRDRNLGYAFATFESHKAAAMAKRKLIIGNIKMWGRDISVDWAQPLDEEMSKPKIEKKNKSKGNNQRAKMDHQYVLRNDIPRFQQNNYGQAQRVGYQAFTPPPVNAGQFTYNNTGFMWSMQQQQQVVGMGNPGMISASGYMNPMSQTNPYYYSHPPNVYQNYVEAKAQPYYYNATVNVSVIPNRRTPGIPGVPSNLYYGQWHQNPQLAPRPTAY